MLVARHIIVNVRQRQISQQLLQPYDGVRGTAARKHAWHLCALSANIICQRALRRISGGVIRCVKLRAGMQLYGILARAISAGALKTRASA